MNYKPPYWYHDNIKFKPEEIEKLKNDIENIHNCRADPYCKMYTCTYTCCIPFLQDFYIDYMRCIDIW